MAKKSRGNLGKRGAGRKHSATRNRLRSTTRTRSRPSLSSSHKKKSSNTRRRTNPTRNKSSHRTYSSKPSQPSQSSQSIRQSYLNSPVMHRPASRSLSNPCTDCNLVCASLLFIFAFQIILLIIIFGSSGRLRDYVCRNRDAPSGLSDCELYDDDWCSGRDCHFYCSGDDVCSESRKRFNTLGWIFILSFAATILGGMLLCVNHSKRKRTPPVSEVKRTSLAVTRQVGSTQRSDYSMALPLPMTAPTPDEDDAGAPVAQMMPSAMMASGYPPEDVDQPGPEYLPPQSIPVPVPFDPVPVAFEPAYAEISPNYL
eukprot:gnl/Dysnectes_brevis/2960_a3641_1056.p1 GENE.gnl/Dysnectes_brevis/2960_a3641_1056~~gnl/Dysnectes_brevis/2960_a3641_1056.p1  ORF type:complete len:313 (+),score=2.99 gnl/Dysnectes_brevis/2960_a3641_1056:37-975(+)